MRRPCIGALSMAEAGRPAEGRGPALALADAQQAKVAILKASDAIRRRATGLLAGRGITFQQYNVLRILRGARAPLPSDQLAGRTIEVIADLPGLLEDLRSRGLVAQEGGEWTVTPAALELLGQLDEPVADADLNAVGELDGSEVRTLVALLERVRGRA